MKASIKYLIVILIFQMTYFPIKSFGQNEHMNLLKYWYYRDRLKHFVIPGTNIGESEVAGTRNRLGVSNPPENIDFGQHGCYFGYYLGILATEYQILLNNEKWAEAACDREEAHMALQQYIDHLDKCEHYYHFDDVYDGFFIRTDVLAEYLDSNSNKGLTRSHIKHLDCLNQDLSPHNFQLGFLVSGHPQYLKDDSLSILSCVYDERFPVFGYEPMSQDEAIGILLGLALVYEYIPSLSDLSENIAGKIITYISNNDTWLILDPTGEAVPDGAFAVAYAFGFAAAGQFFGYCPFEFINSGGPLCPNFQMKRAIWEGIGLTGYVSPINCTM